MKKDKIITFVYSLKKRFLKITAANFFLDFSIFAVGIFYLFLIAAQIGVFTDSRQFFFVIAALVIFLIAKYICDFRKFYKTDELLRHVQNKYPEFLDHLSISYSFLSKPSHIRSEISESLKKSHIEHSAEIIDILDVNKIIPFQTKNKLILFVSTILIIFIFSLVLPFQFKSSLNNTFLKKLPFDISELKVSPGNCEVLYGDSVLLTLRLPHRSGLAHKPSLFVKIADEKLQEVDCVSLSSVSDSDGTDWSFKYDGVFADSKYFFKVGPVKTKEYKITVVKPIMFEEIVVKYDYPSYTGLSQRVVKNEPNLECYRGTTVSITAKATEKIDSAKIVFDTPLNSEKIMKVAKDGVTASARFTATKEKSYKFIISKNKKEFVSPTYSINILKDTAPKLEILSPAQDVIAAADDAVSVIYSYEDDFGVSALNFAYKIGNVEKSVPMTLQSGKKKGIDEYNWRLINIKTQPGDVISYYIMASDEFGNEGFSKTYHIEIASYEKFHSEIMGELRSFSDDLIKLLSAQSVAYEKYKDKIPPPWEELKSAQNEIYDKTQEASERLSETLKKMEEDPFFDGYLLNEYRGIKNTLNYLKDKPLSSAKDKIQQKDFPALQNSQKEAISILERMTLLSEDVWKYQNLSDLESRFSSMEKKFDASLENFSQKTPNELIEDMKEISQIIEDIRKLIEDMPGILPEEFVNSEALKDMNFADAQDVVSGIKDALSKSDYATAKKMMEKLKNELKKMRDAIKKASENLAVKSAPSDISTKISSVARKLNDILRKQQNLYDTTVKYEEIRQKKLFDLQEKLLKELAAKQKDLNQKSQVLKNSVVGVNRSLPLMEKIYDELSSGRVRHSQKFLEDVISNFSDLRVNFLDMEKKKELNGIEEILNGEKEILSKLKSPLKIEFSQNEKNALESVSKKQSSLRDELKSAKNDLGRIMKETAALSYEALNSLNLADGEMLSSSENLSAFETAKSLENQKNVIDILSSSSAQMESVSSAMSGLSFGQKPSPSLKTTAQSGAAGGAYGVKLQRVELPSIDDYKVPPEFREEILKALLEKYPKEYEKVIQRYYRKLIGQ